RRGLQRVLRGPERRGPGGQGSTDFRCRLPEGATYLLPVIPDHEFGVPAQFGAGRCQEGPSHPPIDRSEAVDVEWVHAAHPGHVRQPPHAAPGLVPESPRRITGSLSAIALMFPPEGTALA